MKGLGQILDLTVQKYRQLKAEILLRPFVNMVPNLYVHKLESYARFDTLERLSLSEKSLFFS